MPLTIARRRVRTAVWLGILATVAGVGGSIARAAQVPPPESPPPTSPIIGSPANALCPVLPDEAVDPEVFTEYEGRRVYFCCRKCLRKFERDPTVYLASLAEVMRPGAAEQTDVPEGDVQHEHGDAEPAHADDQEHDPAGQPAGDTRSGPEHEHGPESHGEHEHATPRSAGLPKVLAWLGNFHPPMVNFPIGLLTAAVVGELLFILTRRPTFASAVTFCTWFGGIGALLAAVLGWLFGGLHLADGDWIMTVHRWIGSSAALWAALLLWLNARSHRAGGRRRSFRVALFVGAGLASAAGFLGGAMVYGIDHYAW